MRYLVDGGRTTGRHDGCYIQLMILKGMLQSVSGRHRQVGAIGAAKREYNL